MKLHSKIYIFNFLLLLSFLRSSKADSVSFNEDSICAAVNCGQGTCRAPVVSLFGFDCDCYSGWTKYQIGPLVLPPCIIPNCTLNTGCGTGSPSPPPSPPSAPPPPFNLFDPCTYTWCGNADDGSCKRNGTAFECDCSDGSDNLLDLPTLPCFKECTLGVECQGVKLGKPTTNSPTPDQSSSSLGWRELRRASKIEDCLKLLLILVAVSHRWI